MCGKTERLSHDLIVEIESESKNVTRAPDKSVYLEYFLYFSSKTFVVRTQKRLNETVLLSTQNTCLN